MANPLILTEHLQRSINNINQNVQDFALESLVILIGKYNLEYPSYYEHLYNMIRLRNSFSLKILKILEISLKNSKLTSSTILPFLKLFLRRSMLGNPLEICWLLGLVINVAKMNKSIGLFFQNEGGEFDEYDTLIEFKEVEKIDLKAFEVATLRK